MPSWNTRFWKKSVDVESSDGPSRTAGAVAGSSRHAASILFMHDPATNSKQWHRRVKVQVWSTNPLWSRIRSRGLRVSVIPVNQLSPKRLANNSCLNSIVFVHGLTGSRLSTWTNKGSKILWPESFLSNDISNTRILTLGYDADVINAWASASQNRVGDHANDLNNALCDLRGATKTVSIEHCRCIKTFRLHYSGLRPIVR